MTGSVDVDAILATLPADLNDPGVDRWGGASFHANQSVSRCNVCSCVIVRENVPWNREWRCNGDHNRCTMIGCVPVLK